MHIHSPGVGWGGSGWGWPGGGFRIAFQLRQSVCNNYCRCERGSDATAYCENISLFFLRVGFQHVGEFELLCHVWAPLKD